MEGHIEGVVAIEGENIETRESNSQKKKKEL